MQANMSNAGFISRHLAQPFSTCQSQDEIAARGFRVHPLGCKRLARHIYRILWRSRRVQLRKLGHKADSQYGAVISYHWNLGPSANSAATSLARSYSEVQRNGRGGEC